MKIDKARSIESDKYTEYDIWLNENQVFRVAYNDDKYTGVKLSENFQDGKEKLGQKTMSYGRGISNKLFKYTEINNIINGDYQISGYRPTTHQLKHEAAV